MARVGGEFNPSPATKTRGYNRSPGVAQGLKGGDTCHRTAQNERVNVVGALVGVDHL